MPAFSLNHGLSSLVSRIAAAFSRIARFGDEEKRVEPEPVLDYLETRIIRTFVGDKPARVEKIFFVNEFRVDGGGTLINIENKVVRDGELAFADEDIAAVINYLVKDGSVAYAQSSLFLKVNGLNQVFYGSGCRYQGYRLARQGSFWLRGTRVYTCKEVRLA